MLSSVISLNLTGSLDSLDLLRLQSSFPIETILVLLHQGLSYEVTHVVVYVWGCISTVHSMVCLFLMQHNILPGNVKLLVNRETHEDSSSPSAQSAMPSQACSRGRNFMDLEQNKYLLLMSWATKSMKVKEEERKLFNILNWAWNIMIMKIIL